MKHIAFICDTPTGFHSDSPDKGKLGGVETTVIELSEALVRLGYQVTTLTKWPESLECNGVKWQPLDTLLDCQADVFISCNHAQKFNALNAEAKRHARKIVWLHNPLKVEKAIRKKHFLPLLKYRPDVVCVGNVLRDSLSRLLPFKARHVIGHGIPEIFHNTQPTSIESRA